MASKEETVGSASAIPVLGERSEVRTALVVGDKIEDVRHSVLESEAKSCSLDEDASNEDDKSSHSDSTKCSEGGKSSVYESPRSSFPSSSSGSLGGGDASSQSSVADVETKKDESGNCLSSDGDSKEIPAENSEISLLGASETKSIEEKSVDQIPLSPSSEGIAEAGLKRKSGGTKRFFGIGFSSKGDDKPKGQKKSETPEKIKSPKKPSEPSETIESPKTAKEKEGPTDKIKSPKKLGSREEHSKGSKNTLKSEDSSEKPKESASDSPAKLPRTRSFLQRVNSPQKFVSKLMQRLGPGDPKGNKRPMLSSSCDPDFFVKSPELSPIGDEQRIFSASYLGSRFVYPSNIDRIDYSKLAEDKIIPAFLNNHQCYDVMPTSGKVIVLSVELLVKNAFSALETNEIKAAPLWDSGLHDFVGMLTITDFINVLRHYYYSSPEDIKDIENQSISTWRRITKVATRFVKVNGLGSLAQATKLLIQEGVHRIPVFDEKRQCVLFVLTRKRLLQFLSYNLFDKFEKSSIKPPSFFKRMLREIKVGTYEDIATVTETTKVIEALDLLVERGVSSLPVVDENGVLKDIFGKMDVFALAKEQMYHNLEITVYEVVRKCNPRECAIICTLDETFGTVIKRFITAKSHRIVVIDERRSVVGIISLSDILKFLVVEPLAAMEDSGVTGASDIIEEGAEGAVGGVDGDANVFNEESDSSKDATGESNRNESSKLEAIKDLSISKDNEEESGSENVSKSE